MNIFQFVAFFNSIYFLQHNKHKITSVKRHPDFPLRKPVNIFKRKY
jgi:hypothetical protein